MSSRGDVIANKVLRELCQDIVNQINIDEVALRLFSCYRITSNDLDRLQNINGNLTIQQRKYYLYSNALADKGQEGLDAFLKVLDETADQCATHALLAKKLREKREEYDSMPYTRLAAMHHDLDHNNTANTTHAHHTVNGELSSPSLVSIQRTNAAVSSANYSIMETPQQTAEVT